MTEGLLKDVKNYLDITWEDPEGDKKLAGMISRGISYIDDKGGEKFNYDEEGKARMLLLNYVMYERSGILHEFFGAYQDEIIALQLGTKVKNNAETEE